MSEWREEKLADLVVVDREQLSGSTEGNYAFYYIDISSVSTNKIDLPSEPITFRNAPSRARKILNDGDVLIYTVRPNLKSFARFKQPSPKRFIASTGFAILSEKTGTDLGYVYQYILSDSIERQIESLVVGSNYPAINTRELKGLKINIPPLPVQRKIASILSTIDGQIEKTEAIIAKYQAVKQGMLQDLFTRGIDVRTGQLRPRYEDAPDLYQESMLGMIPKEWAYRTIGDFLTLQRGVDITSKDFVKGNVPVFSSSGLQGYHNKSIANGPGVITGRKGTLGKVYYTDLPYWPHDTTLWVKDFKGNSAQFIYYLLQNMDLSKHDEATANPTLNRNNVHPLKIVFPLDYEEQGLIASSISNHVDRINIEQHTLSKLQLLKQGLMQDLLSGKVEVTA